MKSSQKYPLETLIHVDEFTVGGKEEGKQGRSYDILTPFRFSGIQDFTT